MRTLSRIFFYICIPYLMNGQDNSFYSQYDSSLKKKSFFKNDSIKYFNFYPSLYGVSVHNEAALSTSYLIGLASFSDLSNKISVSGSFNYLGGNHNILLRKYKDSLDIYPGFGKSYNKFNYNIQYRINNFFTLDAGRGNHSIGFGYRSLFLSDEVSSYPYVLLTSSFWKIKYYNLYTAFVDIRESDLYRRKYSASHYLDFKPTDNISICLFESVIWQAMDGVFNRGYDIEYINPVIFYRPVEFSKASPDNVLLGLSIQISLTRFRFYGQFLLDDLNISSGPNTSNGFFQNKFAYQLGFKFKSVKSETFLEYNQVQPYTYAHKTPLQNYTHYNQALAHPFGANFKELVLINSYKKGKWKVNNKSAYVVYGADNDTSHFGQNIFVSDYDAQRAGKEFSYGNFNGQGNKTTVFNSFTEVIYKQERFDLFLGFAYRYKKSELFSENLYMPFIGIRINTDYDFYKDY